MRSAYPFAGWVRSSIHRFKYDGEFARASGLAAEFALVRSNCGPVEIIVPVPIHRRRMRERGFNQSALIARHVSAAWGIPYADSLARQTNQAHQVGRAKAERWLNVQGAFICVDQASVRGKRVLVVDDVITTGATVSMCAVALREAGAQSVKAVSLARG